MIAMPAVPLAPAIVRVQEGPAPVRNGSTRAAAERYVRSHLHVSSTDSSAWKTGFDSTGS
jgi:hypothetical protein